MPTIQDITIILSTANLIFSGLGIISGDIRYMSAAMFAGSGGFLTMNISTSDRIKRNREAIKDNSNDIHLLADEVLSDGNE